MRPCNALVHDTPLAQARVPFEVVPGVWALASVPAAAGIPLTHRGVTAQ